jgi:hypothetical protein
MSRCQKCGGPDRHFALQLAGWFADAAQVLQVKDKLAPLGFCGPHFATSVRKTYDDFSRAVREAKIRAE